MGRVGIWSLVFISSFAEAPLASAYTQAIANNGAPVHWAGAIHVDLVGNPTNQSGLDPDYFFSAVVRGLQRWQAASGGRVHFDYWQGTDPSVYVPNSDFNGVSSVYFASNSATTLSPNVLGLTQVWYSTKSGEILETDTVLNDRDFVFTSNPTDTSGFGSTRRSTEFTSKPHVFVENVLSHELGHVLGFAHSGSLQSTMLYLESPEQAYLACDDQIGIRAMYPADDAAARGELTGVVLSESGAAIDGAHVEAISSRRGAVLASALTDRSGRYVIGGLEPGDYYLLVEPYFAGSGALPPYFGAINPGVCPRGEPFARTALESGAGPGAGPGMRLEPVTVQRGRTSAAPVLVARCSADGGAAVMAAAAPESAGLGAAPVIYDGAAGAEFGAATKLGGASDFALKRVQGGHLEIRVLDYSIYSPIRTKLSLLDASGNEVPTQAFTQVYEGDSGYVNFDSAITADGLPSGDYFLRLSPTAMSASDYPAGPISLDSTPFALITGSINAPEPPLSDEIPFNPRCRMEENFAAYHSPPGPPPRRDHSGAEAESSAAFCASVNSDFGDGPPSSDPGAAAAFGNIVGWFLPWFLMGAAARVSALAQAARGR